MPALHESGVEEVVQRQRLCPLAHDYVDGSLEVVWRPAAGVGKL